MAPQSAPEPVHAPHPILDDYYQDETEKRRFIRRIFDETAGDYERVEKMMAWGSGPWYRRQALVRAGLKPGMQVLDVAIGTGLVAREIQAVLGGNGGVIGIDPSPGMMTSGDNARAITCIQGRAEALPFATASFDFLSLGFALRHMADLERVFKEFRRVLKPGGRVLILEITRPEKRFTQLLMKLYMRGFVPFLSRLVGKHADTPRLFRYYWDTIEACAPPPKVLSTLESAGFSQVDRYVELGVFSEYRGWAAK
jgi:demethylmenaquinone methyltransferase/2-methoxy-6-polyprenyl-1,4-benzoquinol methylase